MVQRRGRLREPRAPGLAAVQRDDGALVDHQQHDVRVVRVPPDVLVVVAAGRALERHERPAAVGRLVADDVGDDERVGILGMDVRHHFVDAADGTRVGRAAHPRLTGVVRPINAGAAPGRLEGHIDAFRIARRDRELGVDNPVRESLLERLPRGAAVDRLEGLALLP